MSEKNQARFSCLHFCFGKTFNSCNVVSTNTNPKGWCFSLCLIVVFNPWTAPFETQKHLLYLQFWSEMHWFYMHWSPVVIRCLPVWYRETVLCIELAHRNVVLFFVLFFYFSMSFSTGKSNTQPCCLASAFSLNVHWINVAMQLNQPSECSFNVYVCGGFFLY